MNTSIQKLQTLTLPASTPKETALQEVRAILEELQYTFADVDESRPWGAYYRVQNEQADRFLTEFFPGVDPIEARLGHPDLALSPKILVVAPGQRLSWQYHTYRAERWHFITPGIFYKSATDEQGPANHAKPGDIVQFATGERHRLAATPDAYTLVAEIWQHTDPSHPSIESDIIRVADDYKR